MDDERFRERDGKQYERVTRVLDYFLDPGLMETERGLGLDELKKRGRAACKIGDRVDELCREDWENNKYRLKKTDGFDVTSCMRAWECWKRDYPEDFKAIREAQTKVWIEEWGVAGKRDFVQTDGILDIKTSKEIYPRYWIQVTVYNKEERLPHRRILRLDKNLGEYEYKEAMAVHPWLTQEYGEQVFIGLLNAYRYYKAIENGGF